ncbi:MAG: FecR domain-containing protein [Bernardetiaceae bacterium]|jgi:ferric-dicitrate binding protein FerR (iron transport regulator)|nr:FecR domain-containing protein [Bernardetiaceae bacterium]
MNFEGYQVEDFLKDEGFQHWAKNPQAAPEWAQRLALWQPQNPGLAARAEEARELILALQFSDDETLPETEAQQLWAKIATAAGEAPASQPGGKTAVLKPARSSGWRQWAAAIALLATLGSLGFWVYDYSRYQRVATDFGQTQTIALPDGSRVTLNARSELKYLRNWQDQADRQVWLEGEAFFEVSKQPTQQTKFKVYTSNLSVEVLGTKFNVAHRPAQTAVTLNEGKIKLAIATATLNQHIEMRPGEQVRFLAAEQKVELDTVRPDNQSAWTKKYWVLDNSPLSEIAARIELLYGYEVDIEQQNLAKERATGVLPTKNIDQLLEILATTYGVKVKKVGNKKILIQ